MLLMHHHNDHNPSHADDLRHSSNESSEEADNESDNNSDSGNNVVSTSSESDDTPTPIIQRPIPAPRRSGRTRHKPHWLSSDEYAMAQIVQSENAAHSLQDFATGCNQVMSQLVNLLQHNS
jgi:hypothetical protein